MAKAAELLPKVRFCRDPFQAAARAEAVVLLIEWNEFKHVHLRRVRDLMAGPVFVDGCNVYDPAQMVALGFDYHSVGRPLPNGEQFNGYQHSA